MAEYDDARKLSSGRPIEEVYASYANELKALANTSRKNALSVNPIPRNASSAKVYANEVESLDRKLTLANMNKPYEREAQVYANSVIVRKRQANPDMDKDELKKVRNQALAEARVRTGAKKAQVDITDREWEAIQAGAISPSKLSQILQNADLDKVKTLATPRTKLTITTAKRERAQSMITSGYTLAEVANALGVSTSTLSKSLNG
jgi:predicted DNA binding protein